METKMIISELRARGLSQRQIADACGLSQGAISHIETGRRKNVFASTRDALVALLAKTPKQGNGPRRDFKQFLSKGGNKISASGG